MKTQSSKPVLCWPKLAITMLILGALYCLAQIIPADRLDNLAKTLLRMD